MAQPWPWRPVRSFLPLPAAAQQITFMTGPQGGSWIPLGGALKSVWETAVPGLQIQQHARAPASRTSAASTRARRRSASRHSSTTVDGVEGRAPYPKKVTKVCQVANLYPQYFQVVALNGREDQIVRRPQGQVARDTAEGQHRRDRSRTTVLQAERHELPVARQGGAFRVHIRTPSRHGEGRPRAGVYARHHHPCVRGDGPCECPRRGSSCRWTEQMVNAHAQDQPRLLSRRRSPRPNTYPKQDKPVDVIA